MLTHCCLVQKNYHIKLLLSIIINLFWLRNDECKILKVLNKILEKITRTIAEGKWKITFCGN